ncbi:MAG: cupin domain-containing protein [Sporichthyaceae bacterium]
MAEPTGNPQQSSFRFIRLYCDVEGTSRFADEELALGPKATGAALEYSEAFEAETFHVVRLPAGTEVVHPAPARQFVVVLAGTIEFTAGGAKRRLSCGDTILAEDTTGVGHGTKALEDVVLGVIRL